jgi:hypothetical protein
MVFVGVSKIEGSFMSFQKPATPAATKPRYREPHQARVSRRVKSGKTEGPGQTCPT